MACSSAVVRAVARAVEKVELKAAPKVVCWAVHSVE